MGTAFNVVYSDLENVDSVLNGFDTFERRSKFVQRKEILRYLNYHCLEPQKNLPGTPAALPKESTYILIPILLYA